MKLNQLEKNILLEALCNYIEQVSENCYNESKYGDEKRAIVLDIYIKDIENVKHKIYNENVE